MKLNELSADERQYAINVISGIIRDKHDKGCENACIECSKDSKGCAREPGGFEWKYKDILEKVIELLRKPEPAADVQSVNQWISCKDKMPDDGVNVLIYAGNRMISLAWYDKDMGYFYICDSDYKYNSLDVTHWQPLPEPPKDGETNA